MKRTLSLILTAVMILAAVPALGEDMTWKEVFAEFQDEDLESICAAAHAEIIRRRGEPFTVAPGIYVIGLDIPEGTFSVEAIDGFTGYFYAYSDYEDLTFPFYSAMIAPDTAGVASSIGRIYLAEGNCIKIDMTCKFSPYGGI